MDLHTFISQLKHPAFILGLDLRLRAINKTGRHWIGLSEGETQISWDKGPGVPLRPILQKTIDLKAPQEDVMVGDHDGRIRSNLFTTQLMTLDDSTFIFAQSLPLSDQTLERLDREALVTAERVALALRSRRVGFWDWNIKDDILTWDKTQFEVFGVDRSEFTNAYEAWASTLSPESREQSVKEVRDALDGVRPYNTEFEIQTKTGDRRLIRGSGICFWDENGDATRLIGLNWDVTQRRKLERDFMEQAFLTKKITEMIPAFLNVGDVKENRVKFHNKKLSEILGVDAASIEQMTFDDFRKYVHPEDRPTYDDYLGRVLALHNNEIAETKFRNIDSAGQEKWIHLRAQIFERDKEGHPTAVITAGMDISEQKRLADSVEIDRAKAFNSAKMAALGEMAGGIAHEINNPLTIIIAKVEQMKKNLRELSFGQATAEPAKLRIEQDMERIVQMCQRIARIIRSMRTVSRTDDSESLQLISIQSVIDDLLILCHQRMASFQIRLNVGPIPAVTMEIRPVQLSQILLNLLNNAVDAVSYLDEKWIRIEFADSPECLQISVTDSGDGIAPEVAARMSEPFYTTKPVGKGTGLGLSISHSLAEQQGGTLIYDSGSPKTRFVLELSKNPRT